MSTQSQPALRYTLLVLFSAFVSAVGINVTEILLRAFTVPAVGIAASANLVGGSFLLAAAAAQGVRGWGGWPLRDWLRLGVAAAVIYALGFVLLYLSVDLVGVSTVSFLGRLQVLFIVILAVLFLGEAWTRRHWAASGLAVVGVGLVAYDPATVDLQFGAGEGLAVLSAFVYAAGIIVLKTLVDRQDGQVVTGYGLLIGAVLLIPFALADGVSLAAVSDGWPWVGAVLGLRGLLLGLAWVTYNVAMRHVGAARASVLFLAGVAFSVGLQLAVNAAAPQVGVRVPGNLPSALCGGILICASIVLLERRRLN